MIGAMTLVWSLRLGTHPAAGWRDTTWSRTAATFSCARTGCRFAVRMFGFFQLQSASVVLLGAALLIASLNPAPALHPFELAGAALLLLALTGEATADRQSPPSSAIRPTAAASCRRPVAIQPPPQLFFEWLVWVAFFVFALGSPHG